MGFTYVSFTLRGCSQLDIAARLGDRSSFVSKKLGDYVLVCDEQSDDLISEDYGALGRNLSAHFGGLCFTAAVFHDDIFAYRLYDDGALVDEYTTHLNGFEVCCGTLAREHLGGITGGNALKLCQAFMRHESVAEVEQVLRAPHDDSKYLWSSARHDALCEKLGMPPFGNSGFHSLYYNEGEFPDGMTESDFLYTGKDVPPSRVKKPS